MAHKSKTTSSLGLSQIIISILILLFIVAFIRVKFFDYCDYDCSMENNPVLKRHDERNQFDNCMEARNMALRIAEEKGYVKSYQEREDLYPFTEGCPEGMQGQNNYITTLKGHSRNYSVNCYMPATHRSYAKCDFY